MIFQLTNVEKNYDSSMTAQFILIVTFIVIILEVNGLKCHDSVFFSLQTIEQSCFQIFIFALMAATAVLYFSSILTP